MKIQKQPIAASLVAPASPPASYDYLWRPGQQSCAACSGKL